MNINLTRFEILNGNYVYPTGLITLKPTTHLLERINERCNGLDCIPSHVRVTRDNIHSAKTKDGRKLHSVVVRLKYTKTKWIFLCVNPFDGYLKSMWFQDMKRKHGKITNRENGKLSVRSDRGSNKVQ